MNGGYMACRKWFLAFVTLGTFANADVSDGEEVVFVDENWIVTKDIDLPGCMFEHRSQNLSVVLGVVETNKSRRESLFYIFTDLPTSQTTTIGRIGDSNLPSFSTASELLVEGGVSYLELEFLSDLDDDLAARLVSQSLIGRFRKFQLLTLGDFELELGNGEAAFSDHNLKLCFDGSVTQREATRLGLPLSTYPPEKK
ncbi:hypothetical protein CSC82_11570 [Rhodobacteraceae bacterium 4F10]|nr:hypothetical protein CSC82_11570 [Rhodobacteraceae bacterium 4F10]